MLQQINVTATVVTQTAAERPQITVESWQPSIKCAQSGTQTTQLAEKTTSQFTTISVAAVLGGSVLIISVVACVVCRRKQVR